MRFRVGRAVVSADEFQFLITCDAATVATDQSTLVSADPGQPFVAVTTGAHWGPVDVITELLAGPAVLEDVWEEIEEVSVIGTEPLVVTELFDATPIVSLTDSGGQWRVRISARGRAAGRDFDYADLDHENADGNEPVEFYLVQAWPAAAEPWRLLRAAQQSGPAEDPGFTTVSVP